VRGHPTGATQPYIENRIGEMYMEMTVQQLIDMLSKVPEELRNRTILMEDENGYYGTIRGIRGLDFTEQGTVYDTHKDPNTGEAVYLVFGH
jgi:hypothetical protein